jgi:hypothetical protein
MKKFNEWLSFRSNSYVETGNNEDNAFDIKNLSGASNPSSVQRIEDKFNQLVDIYGGPSKIRNKMMLLSEIIKSIYDFSDETQMNKIKTDLRTISNKLEMNNNLDDIKSDEEIDELER